MMNIPEDINTRAEAMWRIISQKIDFRGKRVIDLGCGHGEMLWRARIAGATRVVGVDKEIDKVAYGNWPSMLTLDAEPVDEEPSIWLYTGDLDIIVNTPASRCTYDIGFCFSVLPYLRYPEGTLLWMSMAFPLCIIEAQYEPELYNVGVPSDDEMYVLLRNNGFKCATWLGETYVEDRDTHRSIWACSKKMLRL